MENRITTHQYEVALIRLEQLLHLTIEENDSSKEDILELVILSDIIEKYEKEHFPIKIRK